MPTRSILPASSWEISIAGRGAYDSRSPSRYLTQPSERSSLEGRPCAARGVILTAEMTAAQNQRVLYALLDSWDRNNTTLLNLLGAIPDGGLDARAMEGSPTVSEMFTHMHHERMVSVLENAPECAGPV